MKPHIVWTAYPEDSSTWVVSATFRGRDGAVVTRTAVLRGEHRQALDYMPTQLQNLERACAALYSDVGGDSASS
jgi:hypothetical protein